MVTIKIIASNTFIYHYGMMNYSGLIVLVLSIVLYVVYLTPSQEEPFVGQHLEKAKKMLHKSKQIITDHGNNLWKSIIGSQKHYHHYKKKVLQYLNQ